MSISNPTPPGVLLTTKYAYKFAIDGGAVGDIPLRLVSGPPIEVDAVICAVATDMITELQGDPSTTIGETLESSGDLQAPFTVGFFLPGVKANYAAAGISFMLGTSPSTGIKTTAPRTPTLNVTVMDMTQGEFTQTVTWTH